MSVWQVARVSKIGRSLFLLVNCTLYGVAFLTGRSLADETTQAQPSIQVKLAPDSNPLDLKALEPGKAPEGVITQETVSQTGLTVPSLWWNKEQFSAQEQFGGKLLENWLAYPHSDSKPGRIDFVVNRQLWSLLDYLERYSFIHEFGMVARDYGYNIRVFDQQATFLAAYTCDFSSINVARLQNAPSSGLFLSSRAPADGVKVAALPPAAPEQIVCSISLDSTGKSGLSGRSNPFGEGFSR